MSTTLDTTHDIQHAAPGQYWDYKGHPWVHTSDGRWIDECGSDGILGGVLPGSDRGQVAAIFLATIRLSQTRPPWWQRLSPRPRISHQIYVSTLEYYHSIGVTESPILGFFEFHWRMATVLVHQWAQRFK